MIIDFLSWIKSNKLHNIQSKKKFTISDCLMKKNKVIKAMLREVETAELLGEGNFVKDLEGDSKLYTVHLEGGRITIDFKRRDGKIAYAERFDGKHALMSTQITMGTKERRD